MLYVGVQLVSLFILHCPRLNAWTSLAARCPLRIDNPALKPLWVTSALSHNCLSWNWPAWVLKELWARRLQSSSSVLPPALPRLKKNTSFHPSNGTLKAEEPLFAIYHLIKSPGSFISKVINGVMGPFRCLQKQILASRSSSKNADWSLQVVKRPEEKPASTFSRALSQTVGLVSVCLCVCVCIVCVLKLMTCTMFCPFGWDLPGSQNRDSD